MVPIHYYCALCGAPAFQPQWDPENDDVDEGKPPRYSKDILSGPQDPELGWLSYVKIIEEVSSQSSGSISLTLPQLPPSGEASHSGAAEPLNDQAGDIDADGISWKDYDGHSWLWDPPGGPVDDSYPWPVPVHPGCVEILCRYLEIPTSQLNKRSFFDVLKTFGDEPCGIHLNIDYGDIESGMGDVWCRYGGEEYFLFNPVQVTGLKELYENPPRYDGSITQTR
ncbi:unnamed protein product [Clonostachys rosea]|uniref:Uncharacterized protein n=1 Tax=Bionectria ochroleuca TaxID=29856 RepID=A0ABY6UFR0_BIOOC|nr:unnamed protein product [Clonostachys rosea]